MEVKIIKASDRHYLTPEVKAALKAAGYIPIVVNDVYIPYIWDRTRFQNFYGGSGGGKSDFVAVRYLIWALTYKYFRLLFSRKFKETIKDSQFLLLKDVIAREELGEYFEVKEQPMDIKCLINGNLMLSGGLDDIDPNTIGNGSIGHIRIFQYEYPKKEGGMGTATILMGIQITTHIEFERKAREDEFGVTETTTIPVESSGEDDFKVPTKPKTPVPKVATPSLPKSPSLTKSAPADHDDMDDDIPF